MIKTTIRALHLAEHAATLIAPKNMYEDSDFKTVDELADRLWPIVGELTMQLRALYGLTIEMSNLDEKTDSLKKDWSKD